MRTWAILCLTMTAGWSCSCGTAQICDQAADCEGGMICLGGLCATACNSDCDCPSDQGCGPIGACVAGPHLCQDGEPPRCGGADLENDPKNCGVCGRQCAYPGGVGLCSVGQCQISRCKPGYHDIDGRPGNGCEYLCVVDPQQPDERCDGIDNDCDGEIDEEPLQLWYLDADDDGRGDDEQPRQAACQPEGYVALGGDCDDGDPSAAPGLAEVCDGVDNNCNGDTDEGVLVAFYRDADGDQFGVADSVQEACRPPDGYVRDPGDCDPDRSDVHPGATERCDGRDNDCDGQIDEGFLLAERYADTDGDGFGGGDPITVCVNAEGFTDNRTDCDDTDPSRYPGAPERCDAMDQDCDGVADNNLVVRLVSQSDAASLTADLTSLTMDNATLRWGFEQDGVTTIRQSPRQGQQVSDMPGAGVVAPLRLPPLGQAEGLLGWDGARCRTQIGAAGWRDLLPQDCRPLAVCPIAADGAESWQVLLALPNSGDEVVALYEIIADGTATPLRTVLSEVSALRGACTDGGLVAVGVAAAGGETIYTGVQALHPAATAAAPMQGIDLMRLANSKALVAISRADGSVSVVSVDAIGQPLSEQIHVAITKSAGVARLVAAPNADGQNGGRALLVYPVLSPQQSQGLWAIPLNSNGDLLGDDQHLTQDVVSQVLTAATSEDDGNGSLVSVGEGRLILSTVSCGAP